MAKPPIEYRPRPRVGQVAERPARKREDAGSKPAGGTKRKRAITINTGLLPPPSKSLSTSAENLDPALYLDPLPVLDGKSKFDRNAYQRDYMADKRAAKRLGISVSVYRARKVLEAQKS